MLSMCELRRVVAILDESLPGSVLKRIVPGNIYTLVLAFVDSAKNKTGVLLSCDPEFARICTVRGPSATDSSTASFYEYIRAHLQGAVVSGIGDIKTSRTGVIGNPGGRIPGACTFQFWALAAISIWWMPGSF